MRISRCVVVFRELEESHAALSMDESLNVPKVSQIRGDCTKKNENEDYPVKCLQTHPKMKTLLRN